MNEQVTFTREELYEMVWSTPRSRIAKEYLISDVGLTKLCARQAIPAPPRGHWARVAAGESPRRPPLPSPNDRGGAEIRLARRDSGLDEPEDELAPLIAELRLPEERIVVSERLRSPCEAVAAARALLTDAKADGCGLLDRPPACIDIHVSRSELPRALRIADALFKAFEKRGWTVEVGEKGTDILVAGERIAITIEERVETVEITPKPDLEGTYTFHYDRRETARRPSGRLEVRLQEDHRFWGSNHRRKWRDAKTRRVEDRLNNVLIGMVKLASAIRADVAEREREAARERQRKAEIEAALEEQRRLKAEVAREKANVNALLQQANNWRKSRDLRGLVDEARRRGVVPGLGLHGLQAEEWIEWALLHADRLDPFVPSPPSILDEADRIEHMCDGLRWRR
jgi:hypothetical protein